MKNKLIRELAKRAHEDVRSDEEANGVCFKDYNLQFEKAFAKFLILECGNIAFEHWALTHDTSPQEAILKNFGVEE